jgi:hypothetical protein
MGEAHPLSGLRQPYASAGALFFRQGNQLRQDGPQRASAVADCPFDGPAEFAKRAVVLDDFKQRVVAEATAARLLKPDATMTNVLAFRANCPGWIGDGDVADVLRCAAVERNVAKFMQQPAIVRAIWAARCRVDDR